MDLALLWLWHRPAAVTLIGPLDWEPPYVRGAALKRQKTQEKKNKKEMTTVLGGIDNEMWMWLLAEADYKYSFFISFSSIYFLIILC